MTIVATKKKTKHDGLFLLFEGVPGVFAHGQLHILNVLFRLTAVCEVAMSNKKVQKKKERKKKRDKVKCSNCRACVLSFHPNGKLNAAGDDGGRKVGAV